MKLDRSCAGARVGLLSGLLALLGGAPAARADTRLPAVFGDHMVLQQQMPIPVWGTDTPGQAVTVSLAGSKAVARVGTDGKWLVKLPPQKAGGPPLDLSVAGSS